MSVDCMALGPYNVAKRSSFNTEAEVAPAPLHAARSKILCELRSVSVCNEDVLRLRVHPESRGFASVACRLASFSESSAQPRNPEKDDLATDKHRMLWMISTSELRSISSQNHARSAGSQDYRYHTPAATISLELLDLAYQKGSLHVITAAPKRDYSLRITLNPDVSEVGD